MPKITSKSTGMASKSITDFFTRRPPSRSQQSRTDARTAALSQTSTTSSTPTKIQPRDKPAAKIAPTSLKSASRSEHSVSTSVPETMRSSNPRRNARNAKTAPADHGPGERATFASSSSAKSSSAATIQPPQKRKKSSNDESDVEQHPSSNASAAKRIPSKINVVASILTPSPTTKLNSAHCLVTPPISHKRPRLSSPQPTIACSIVPSSQSDEMDVDVSKLTLHDAGDKGTKVDQWLEDYRLVNGRESSVPVTSVTFEDDSTSVVSASSSASKLSRFTHDGSEAKTANTSVDCNAFANPLTPPPSSPSTPPLLDSPVILSAEDKAAQIIAEIKARCSVTQDSDEEKPSLQLDDVLESDSDDDTLAGPIIPLEKFTRAPAPPVASTSRRYDLRGQHIPPAEASTSRSRRNISAPSKYPPSVVDTKGKKDQGKAKAKSRGSAVPFEALLREKKRAEKKGNGADALRAAEDAVAGRKAMLGEMDDEAWLDEGAAFNALQYRDQLEEDLNPSGAAPTTDTEIVMNEADQRRLFGDKGVKGLKGILDSDKARLGEVIVKPFGIPLWLTETDAMCIEKVLPSFASDSQDHVLIEVTAALQNNDVHLAALLVETASLTTLSEMATFLCHLAFSDVGDLGTSAYLALSRLWSVPGQVACPMMATSVYSALIQAGADPLVLEKYGWKLTDRLSGPIPDAHTQAKIVARLLHLVISAARHSLLVPQDIPDILLALFHIALDTSCSQETTRDIIIAVDAVCSAIAKENVIESSVESTVCTRVLGFVSNMEPIHKAYVVSLLASGSGRAARLARWIARSVLLGKQNVSKTSYTELPNLIPLVQVLLPAADSASTSGPPDAFQIHPNTDYVNMGFYVQILAIALSDVDRYTAKEKDEIKREPSSSLLSSPGRLNDKPETPLQLVRSAIDSLHSRIADTRAAHLDRSRTKASLKQLSMRIHFQRVAAISSLPLGRKTLKQYFPLASSSKTS